MRFKVIDLVSGQTMVSHEVTTNNWSWVWYNGFSFVSMSTRHRFQFESVSAA
eukprot:CAMPEP_0202913602 /NCGR_PEP_ID=MMETSP1392-20130828/60901_1 /ASSEMBLY_ACC=CAM_ASM_000868 /TAXON_ID=225041 /ORGANISM="Chlamydomonas chlamydogama, Strain SAG 11-48b" /LENGTH=51 /DNA_ID=CAMNT_0049604915 /DNA_START=89 /DNA_END=240 /DNA_ORIENTATION=+